MENNPAQEAVTQQVTEELQGPKVVALDWADRGYLRDRGAFQPLSGGLAPSQWLIRTKERSLYSQIGAVGNQDHTLFATAQTSPEEPEVTVEAPAERLCLSAGLDAHDRLCESDQGRYNPIDPENDKGS